MGQTDQYDCLVKKRFLEINFVEREIFVSFLSGRNYLSPNESLLICMHKAANAELTDTLFKQHLLASLQKLSLR